MRAKSATFSSIWALVIETLLAPRYMQNFAEVVRGFLQQGGAVQVRDAAELERELGELLANKARREQLGRNALEVVRENLGAVIRTVDMIVDHLAPGN